MKLAELPQVDDSRSIFAFAMSYNGYEQFGLFEGAADAARSGDRSSLDLVRNELFFAARASRYRGDDRYVELYRDLLPNLRKFSSD